MSTTNKPAKSLELRVYLFDEDITNNYFDTHKLICILYYIGHLYKTGEIMFESRGDYSVR